MQSCQVLFKSTLSNHVCGVRRFADLSVVVERALFRAWQDRKDVPAEEELVREQRRLVVQTATAYSGCGLPWDELIIEAHIGLMRAVCRFDSDRDVDFAAYASWWIEAAIQDLMVRNWSRRTMTRLPPPRTRPRSMGTNADTPAPIDP